MDRVSIIKAIVDADKKARAFPQDAEGELVGLDAALANERKALRDSYFERAERRIEAVKAAENEYVADAISALEERHKADVRATEAAAKAGHEAWSDALFRAVIGEPLGE